jgi:hypothetical protein
MSWARRDLFQPDPLKCFDSFEEICGIIESTPEKGGNKMKKGIVLSILFVMSILVISLPASGQETEFTIARLVVGAGVENREPVGVAETFPATTEKVYCFLEATDILKDTEVSFVWFYGDQEMLKTNLPLQTGLKWRTFADKNLRGMKGDWKVEVRDAKGNLVKDIKFKVE